MGTLAKKLLILNTTIKDFKLEILMYVLIHPPPNIGPLTPNTPISSSIPLLN
jgi:hypothetical protein